VERELTKITIKIKKIIKFISQIKRANILLSADKLRDLKGYKYKTITYPEYPNVDWEKDGKLI
jgi:hypothetical protein